MKYENIKSVKLIHLKYGIYVVQLYVTNYTI